LQAAGDAALISHSLAEVMQAPFSSRRPSRHLRATDTHIGAINPVKKKFAKILVALNFRGAGPVGQLAVNNREKEKGSPLQSLLAATLGLSLHPSAANVAAAPALEAPAQAKSSKEKKLTPFARGRPAGISLTGAVMKKIVKGEVWTKTEISGNTAVAQAVMDVEASTTVVWNQLLGFPSYPKKAPMLSSCEIYQRKDEGGGLERILVKFISPIAMGIKLIYHIDHTYEAPKKSITWTLDDSKKNDFQEIQGHWHVEEHPDSPSKSRVFYEIGLVAPSWLPKFVVSKLATSTTRDATAWVKRESELEAANANMKTKLFQPGQPSITVDDSVQKVLKKGGTWESILFNNNTAMGQAVLDIEAPASTVWNHLLESAAYPKHVPGWSTCDVYEGQAKAKKRRRRRKIQEKFVKLARPVIPGKNLTFHVAQTYVPKKKSVTWMLDDKKKNDIEDFQGHWHVEQHPDNKSKSRVFLEMGLEAPHWIPGRMLTQSLMNDATSWLKRETEFKAFKAAEVLRMRGGSNVPDASWTSLQPVRVQGGELETWSFKDTTRLLVAMSSEDESLTTWKDEGRLMEVAISLCEGPDNTPFQLKLKSGKGAYRSFRGVIETPGKHSSLFVRNTGNLEFPITAGVAAQTDEDPEEAVPATVYDMTDPYLLQGNSVKIYPVERAVEKVKVLVTTNGRPMTAKVELLLGPNSVRYEMDVYSEDGQKWPFCTIIETPGQDNAVRIVNTGDWQFPIKVDVQPL